ncbi:MAG TPA: hypothetical protein VIV12_27225 [Streptosporangiaceae bacterium]
MPTEVNLREAYGSFAELALACEQFCEVVNGRVHREICAAPAQRLEAERARLHKLPDAPHTAALGQTRVVGSDQTVRFGSVRYSVPPGLVGSELWVRADGDELVVVADLAALPLRPAWAAGRLGLAEVARHQLSVPGNPRIDLAHYPGHPQRPDGTPRPPRIEAVTDAEAAFLAIGDGAQAWLTEAAAAGACRVRANGRGGRARRARRDRRGGCRARHGGAGGLVPLQRLGVRRVDHRDLAEILLAQRVIHRLGVHPAGLHHHVGHARRRSSRAISCSTP